MRFLAEEQDAGLTLGVFLRRRGVSMAAVRSLKWLEDGLCVNGLRAHTNHRLAPGDVVELGEAAEDYSALPQQIALDIVYEDDAVLVVNKPPGMATHPSRGWGVGTLANAYSGLLQARGVRGAFRPVGRLDADTSGLVLCAKNAVVVPRMAQSLVKGYLALVGGGMRPGPGRINAPLGPQPGHAVRQQVRPGGKPALTEYVVLDTNDVASCVWVMPKTGRTHQIRTHFAHVGHPLLGDGLYGGNAACMGRQALHCAHVAFAQLLGQGIQLACPPPADMQQAAEQVGLTLPPQGRNAPGFAVGR